MGGPSCLHSLGEEVSILWWVSICGCAKHVKRSFPLTPHPCLSQHPLVWSPQHAGRSGLCWWQDAFCLSRWPPASSADLGHPPLLRGSVRLSPGRLGKCWQQLMLARPALTAEMVVHLVTFSFFQEFWQTSLHMFGARSWCWEGC